MNKRNWMIMICALGLMGSATGVLIYYHGHQRLGEPGVKTSPIPGDVRLNVFLPEKVLDYTSQVVPTDQMTLDVLPKDTSLMARRYVGPDGFGVTLNVVLMGGDRTSLHKPQFCLEGAGLHLDANATLETKVRVEQPRPYDLPVVKLVGTAEVEEHGQKREIRGVYVYWYVADGAVSATALGGERQWWMAKELLTTGVLQRWAYISCVALCFPGQEEATFERLKRFIAAATPEFQLAVPPASATELAAKP